MADPNKIDNSIKFQIQLIERLYFRKIQKVVYECGAKCCDDSNASTREVQYCVAKCNDVLIETQRFVNSEMNNYQARMQSCIRQCNDEAKDLLGASPSDAQVEKANKFFNKCARQCTDKYIDILPQFMSKIHEVMEKRVSETQKPQKDRL